MRYVVRNNFFGLDGAPEKQKTKEKEPIPTTRPGEPNERGRGPTLSLALSGEKGSLEQVNKEDISKGERVKEEQINQKNDQVCSVTGQAKRLNSEGTVVKGSQSLDLSSTDEFTLNIYDDEVWESPAAIV